MRGFSGDLVLHQELIDAEINAKTVFHQCQSADGEGQTAKRHRRARRHLNSAFTTAFTESFLRCVYFWPTPMNMMGWPVL